MAKAQSADAMIELFNSVCVSSYPSFDSLEGRFEVAGFERNDPIGWLHPDFAAIGPGRLANVDRNSCSFVARGALKSEDLADYLQDNLDQLDVQATKVTRRGIRLFVDFTKAGDDSRILINPQRGGRATIAIFPLENE